MSRRSATALSILLLTVALAVSTTIFGVVDALVLHPAPFPRPHTLVEINSANAESVSGIPYMPPDLAQLWHERTDLFEAVGTYVQGGMALIGDLENGRQQVVQTYVTPGFIELLGVRPVVGRTFFPGEGQPGNDRVVVINETIWRARFNRDTGVVGRPLTVNGEPMTLVGVMPADFRYPALTPGLWRPLDLERPAIDRLAQVIARTRGDRDLATVQTHVAAAAAQIMPRASKPWRYSSARLRPLNDPRIDERNRQSLWLLFGATLLLLLTACANVANLTMAQLFARVRDNAIQSALGASRSRLVRQALAEQLIIGLASLALALPLVYFGLTAASTLLPSSMTVSSVNVIDLDARVVVLLAALALAVPVLAGVVPALVGSRASVLTFLNSGSRSTTSGRGSRLFRQALVVAEIGCAVVLLVTGALLVTSFLRMQRVDRGFDTSSLVYARLYYPTEDFPSPLSRRLHIDRVLDDLPSMPGVAAVTLTSGVPPNGGQITFGRLVLEGRPGGTSDPISLPIYIVRPDFFSVTGIPIVQGRAFREDDTAAQVIVSASMAAAFWPQSSAVGQRYRWDSEQRWREVVGVAGEVRSAGLDEPRGPFEAYYPYGRPPASTVSGAAGPKTFGISGSASIIVRADDVRRAVPLIRETLARHDRRVIVDTVSRVEDLYQETTARQRLLLVMMVGFSAAGLVIAVAGVYGVLSGLVTQQLREIGLRIMLGATPREMSRVVLRGGLVLTGLGAFIGMAVAAAVSRLISSVLFDVEATDVTSYLVVALVLGASALAAAWRPARRASRVDPAVLLRES